MTVLHKERSILSTMTNHLLIEKDQKHRKLALDASQSFIVQAPAGSGKTELLIQRFLTLLKYVKKPEEILAITFTKKAANEMRMRINKALKDAVEPEPESAHAKETWKLAREVLIRDQQLNWNLIENPNQLRIQTIDSLCAYLTKQLPLLSHFGSSPDLATNPTFMYSEAVQEVLMHVEENFEWSQAIAKLLLHLDNDLNKLHDLLVNLLTKRDQWLPYIHLNSNHEDIRKHLENHLELIIQDTLNSLCETFPSEYGSELIEIARYAADNLALTQPTNALLACRNLCNLPGNQVKDKSIWLALGKLLLTKSFSWRKRLDEDIGFVAQNKIKNPQEKIVQSVFRQRLTTLITKLSENENLRLALSSVSFLPDAKYSDEQWDILKSLLLLLKIVTAQLRVSFQQYGQIDFIENAQAALLALNHDDLPTDLALALDYQIKHILVDEFQDTSFTQYQLLEKLTAGWQPNDGRTLFVVGDPMQSIYRFREAEVGLFIRMLKYGIGSIKLTPLTLAINFRSTSDIVEWNNFHFKTIFPLASDMATGAVSFSPSVSHHTNKETNVQINGFLDSQDNIQAIHIAKLIKEIQENKPNEKIAILVRSRSHLSSIIPELKKANLSYRAIDIDPLASKQIILDLLSLTCALLHPADRISWLAILRAPWCGLTLSDLLIIAGENASDTILQQLEKVEIQNRLSADGQIRLRQLWNVLKKQIAERQRSNLRAWVEQTWLQIGGPATLKEYADIEDANAYFNLLDEFAQNEPALNLDKLKEKISHLYANAEHDQANLQIMTIHTAKGLEFDTVILPHLERKLPHDDKALLAWMEQPLAKGQIALLLAPIHATDQDNDVLYDYINRCKKIKNNYETDRLFYVATTRAKKQLYLLFNTTKNENGHFKVESGSFLEKIWPFIENKKDKILIPDFINEATDSNAIVSRKISRLALTWQNPLANPATEMRFQQEQHGFEFKSNTPKIVGTVIHRLLQLISEHGLTWWQENKNQSAYLKQTLLQAGIIPSELEATSTIAQSSIANILNDTRGQWILHSHAEAKSEFAITAIVDNKPIHLVIDRTFKDEKGTRWIIDYKTTTFSHEDMEIFLEKEQEKYLEKMNLYAKAMRLLDDTPLRIGLYFPALPAWKEWGL